MAACASEAPRPDGTASSVQPTGMPGSLSPARSPRPTPTPAATTPPDGGPSLERQLLGLLVVGFRGARLSDAPWLRDAIDAGLGGVILFDRDQQTGDERNVRAPDQVRALTAEILARRPAAPPIIAIDQEGGVVTRLSPAHGFPPVASEGAIGEASSAEVRRWARDLAGTLANAGATLNLAPVVDLDVNPGSPAIGALGRAFSADPEVVVHCATIEVRAHRAAGVATALKHFPGIGSSTGNTDTGLVDVTDTWSREELVPFRRLIADGMADVVMVGHVVDRHTDGDHPASLSPVFVGKLLRGELGWAGPTITDDLQAAAIAAVHGPAAAARLALAAGNDLLLFANQQAYDEGIVSRVVTALGEAVRDGRLSRDRVEEAWSRAASRFGWTAT